MTERPAMLLVAIALLGVNLPASASVERRAGIGVGLRAGRGHDQGWAYVPALMPVQVVFDDHFGVGLEAELGAHYLALRPNASLIACTVGDGQCISVGASVGLVSAAFDTDQRSTSLLLGGALAYQNRLGPTRYAARIQGEILAADQGGASPGWRSGIGMSLVVLRNF